MIKRFVGVVILVCSFISLTLGQAANGKLQLHFMDVGQGDGALLISPGGETVLFDNGVLNNCDKPVSYLQQLGITKIDYQIVSHYHSDHFGCTGQILTEFPLQKAAIDRGGSYPSATFNSYVMKVGNKRQIATVGTTITLDSSSSKPVSIKIVCVNANGIVTDNKNDLSLVALIQYGEFDAIIGGDLSGYKTESYEDVETPLTSSVGQVELYKVHHHGSRYSSNTNWLNTIKPLVGIISTGNGNNFGHPSFECLERLHKAGVKTYWTELGAGATPEQGYDKIGKNIIIEVAPSATNFTVTFNDTSVDSFPFWGVATVPIPKFAWSRRSSKYHFANCEYVKNISTNNLQTSDTVPTGKSLHIGCPK